jgi:hypothetical protein
MQKDPIRCLHQPIQTSIVLFHASERKVVALATRRAMWAIEFEHASPTVEISRFNPRKLFVVAASRALPDLFLPKTFSIPSPGNSEDPGGFQ